MKILNYMSTRSSHKSSPAVSSIKINHQGLKCFPNAYEPPLNSRCYYSDWLKFHNEDPQTWCDLWTCYRVPSTVNMEWCKFPYVRKKNAIIRLTVLCNTERNMVTWDLCTPMINEMQQPPVTCDAAPNYGNMEIYAGLRSCPYAHHEHLMGNGGNAPPSLILNLNTRWKWIISFTETSHCWANQRSVSICTVHSS